MYIIGQDGRARDHGRCTCQDCNAKYAQHNKYERCECGECAQYRETGYHTPPPVTRPEDRLTPGTWSYSQPESHRDRVNREKREREQEKTMANIQMCDREGCESLLIKNCAGVLSLDPGAYMPSDDAAEQKNWTLCPLCQAEVDRLLHSAPIDDRPRRQDKPYKGWTDTDQLNENDAVMLATDEQLAAVLLQRLMKQAQRQIGSSTVVDHEED